MSVLIATVFSVLLICLLWVHSKTQPQSVGLFVTIGGPLATMRCGGTRLLVVQVLPEKLKLNVEDVDDRTLLDRLRVMAIGSVVHGIYIVARPDVAAGSVIHVVDVVNNSRLNFPIVLVTPTVERGACPRS